MDLRKLKTLIDLVADSTIAELEVTEGESKVRIVKSSTAIAAPPVQYLQMPIATAAPAAIGAASAGSAASTVTAAAVPEVPAGNIVKSPMVGTFYRAPSPDKPVYVETGSTVKAADPVCIIEAMKLLNEIESGFDGVIKEILVENGQPVEFGQPLFLVA